MRQGSNEVCLSVCQSRGICGQTVIPALRGADKDLAQKAVTGEVTGEVTVMLQMR